MFVGSLGSSKDVSEAPEPTTGVSTQASVQDRARLDPQGVKTGPNGMTIRGVTYYKSSDQMVADDGEPGENCESWNTRVVVTTVLTVCVVDILEFHFCLSVVCHLHYSMYDY